MKNNLLTIKKAGGFNPQPQQEQDLNPYGYLNCRANVLKEYGIF